MILLRRENKCPPNQCESGDPGKWVAHLSLMQLQKDGGRGNKWYIRHGALLRNCNSKCHMWCASLVPPIIQDNSQEITSFLCHNNILSLVSQINNIGYCFKQHLLHPPTSLKSTTPVSVWSESQVPSLVFGYRYAPHSESLFLISSIIKEQVSLAPLVL